MTIPFLTDRQVHCLNALATYQYLTTQQMVRLGLGSSRSHVIERVLKGLHPEQPDRPRNASNRLMGRKIFGGIIGKGYLHDLYYLTPVGAQYIANLHDKPLAQIRYPKFGQPQFVRDYFHRILFVDTHQYLVQWAKHRGYQIQWLYRYFDYNPSRQPLTRTVLSNGEIIIPDGILGLIDSQGRRWAVFIEIHRGKTVKPLLAQIQKIDIFIQSQDKNSDHKTPYRMTVLVVFEQEQCHTQFLKVIHDAPLSSRINTLTNTMLR